MGGVADGSAPEDLWHLTIDDLLVGPSEAVRVEGTGPFVVTLSASNSPPPLPPRGLLKFEHLHLYQVQYRENGQLRFRLRLGPITTELEADVVLAAVREHYPRAWMSTADEDDQRALELAAARGPKSRAPVEVVAAPTLAPARAPVVAEPPKTVVPVLLTDTVTLGVPRKKARAAPPTESRAKSPPPSAPAASASAPMSIRDLAAAVLAPSPPPAPRAEARPPAAPRHAGPPAAPASAFEPDSSPARELAMRRALATIRPGQKLPSRDPAAKAPGAAAAAAPQPPTALEVKNVEPPPPVAPPMAAVIPDPPAPAPAPAAPVANRPEAPSKTSLGVAAPTPAVSGAPVRPQAPEPVSAREPTAAPVVVAPVWIELSDATPAPTPNTTSTPATAAEGTVAARAATDDESASPAPMWIEFTDTPELTVATPKPAAAPASADEPLAPAPLWIEFTEEPSDFADLAAPAPAAASPAVEAPAPLWIEFTDTPPLPDAPSSATPPVATPHTRAVLVEKKALPPPAPPPAVVPALAVSQKMRGLQKRPAPAAPAAPPTPAVTLKPAVILPASVPSRASARPAIAAPASHAQGDQRPAAPVGGTPAANPEKAVPALDRTQTMRALTPLELADPSTSRLFVVQLALSENEFSPESVPNLGIFDEYRLYSAMGLDAERIMHALRLGFFTDEASAEAVAGYLRTHFETAAVKRVSEAERERFGDRRVEARKDAGATGVHAAIELSSPELVPTTRLSDLSKRSHRRGSDERSR